MTSGQNPGLTQLFEEQIQVMTACLALSKAQSTLIAEENTEALLENLEKRAELIGRANKLSPEINRLLKAISPADKAAADLKQQLSRILQEITEIDNKNRLAARERMDHFQAEMRRLVDTRKGANAYMKGAELFSSAYFDEKQ